MPRPRAHSREQVLQRAMERFWWFGFHATSMDDLVKATKVSRHGLYSEFHGKSELYLACLAFYDLQVVSPAFSCVETRDASMPEIERYFEIQISRAAQGGLPGPGCLIANTLTEVAPHEAAVMKAAKAHNSRLKKGFACALMNASNASLTKSQTNELASFLVISAQGLWAISRTVSNARVLRRQASILLELVKYRIAK